MLKILIAGSVACSVQAYCAKDGCPFSFTNPSYQHEGRCGEVDAAPRMPDDIWSDTKAVEEYVRFTEQLYHVGGAFLRNEPCNHAWTQKGGENVSWTDRTLMQDTCDYQCKCRYPDCKDVPDDPETHHYCSLCGPKFNAPIEVKFWYKGSGPAPGPSPGPAPGNVCKNTEYCCPDAKKCLTPTLKSCALDPTGCGTGEVCCPLTKICVIPGADCVSPCADTNHFCCPDAKACLAPVASKLGLFCDPAIAGACGTGEVCCPLIKECVAVGDKCSPP